MTLKGREDLPFESAREFDFESALVIPVTRDDPKTGKPYSERRFMAIGKIGAKTVMHVYTPVPEPVIFRTISLRPASKKERKAWLDAKSKKPPK